MPRAAPWIRLEDIAITTSYLQQTAYAFPQENKVNQSILGAFPLKTLV
jgi:hypothetical protein